MAPDQVDNHFLQVKKVVTLVNDIQIGKMMAGNPVVHTVEHPMVQQMETMKKGLTRMGSSPVRNRIPRMNQYMAHHCSLMSLAS